jgi:TolB protein
MLGAADSASAQWLHRYPKLADFAHHTYLEQHELPILAHGPTDPAPAPDGRHLAFAARGWIWRLDLESGTATRLTSGPGTDARPRWSPDGERLAFVRDDGRDTAIGVLDLGSGREAVIDTPTLELDPEFSADGESLYYTSGIGDVLSLWRRHIASGAQERLTDLPQVERNARRLPGGTGLLYLHGAGPHRVLRARDFLAGRDEIVHRETLTYHLTADVHPTERLAVYSAPIDNAYHLWTLDLDDPRVAHRLTDGDPFALTPAFSADGEQVVFVELGEARQFRLMRIPTYGGEAQPIEVTSWDYGEATGRLSVLVTDAAGDPVTARVSVTRADGHPVAFHGDATYVDVQTGRPFFYVEGETTLTVPAGDYSVLAARGPLVPMVEESVRVAPEGTADFRATLKPLWDAAAAGYVSADHHVHLNGDGHHRADHDDALRVLAGEDLDLVAPMSWNRWERRIDAELVGRVTARDGRIVAQGQEVRSHFHGHIGLNGVSRPFAPWFFGPSNPTLGNPDLTNGEVLEFADATGAFATYVHPTEVEGDPFDSLEEGSIPLELVSDAVLAERMGLELACVWTSPLDTAQLWYRLLNIGRPVAAMSGTDSWVDFHRTVAVGTGRNYLRAGDADITAASVLDAAVAGRGFVTTGPALVFRIDDDARPGDVVSSGRRTWQALLASTTDLDVVELVVNGAVVERLEGIQAGETRRYEGDVDLPEGGWIAARASASDGVDDAWPTMHARPFAHSSPIWIGSIGSTEPAARRRAAADLIRAIDASERSAREAYGEVETPRMQSRFGRARAALRELMDGGAP